MESLPFNLHSILSQIEELSTSSKEVPVQSRLESQKLFQECVQSIQDKVDQIVSDHCDVGFFKDDELDSYMDRLRDELRMMEIENAAVHNEIEGLTKSYVQGTCQLESNLEYLRHTVDFVKSKGLVQANSRELVDNFKQGEGHPKLLNAHGDRYFEIMELKHKIEQNEVTLKSMQDLDFNLKRIEAIEKIEEAVTGLKMIDFEDNCIRISLKTYIPNVDGLMSQLRAVNDTKLSEVNHELLIEVMDGTMELKHVEIFPNDVYLGEILEAANTFSKMFSMLSVLETRSSLGWFLQKVQDRIVICTLRQLMVKKANDSRHSFEYLDKEELIVAHMIGGVDAFIKPSQGWPLSISALKLVSLRSSDQNAKDISLSLLCKVEEVANSLEFNVRKSITNFVDGIEEILMEKMRLANDS